MEHDRLGWSLCHPWVYLMLASLKLPQKGKNPCTQQLAFVQAFFFVGSEMGDESVKWEMKPASEQQCSQLGKAKLRIECLMGPLGSNGLDFLIIWTYSLLLFKRSTQFFTEDPLIIIYQSLEIPTHLKESLQGKKIPILFPQVYFRRKVSLTSPVLEWFVQNKMKRGHCVP